MSRPTAGTLTGAGFSQIGSTTKYTKTQGTALATVDIGNGGAATGSLQITPAAAGTPMTTADFQSHVALLVSLGVVMDRNMPNEGNVGHCQSYGQTL